MKSSDPQTMPLFTDQEAPGRRMIARIAANGQGALSKEQKAFNNLLGKIEARRALLADWQSAIAAFQQRYATDLLPLQKQEADLMREAARALDQAHDRKGCTKSEKNKLAVFIADFARKVVAANGDEECKALYAKYSDSDFDEEQAAEFEGLKALLGDALGVDIGDLDVNDPPEKMFARLNELMDASEEEDAKQAKRKKSAKQLAKEAKEAEEEKLMSQSIREVYRKLVGALHPDRETDPEEKRRKTELMQQVNEAYAKGNLLELLELQLRLEHIDEAHLASLDPKKLKRYNQILKDQLEELEMEICFLTEGFAVDFNISPHTLPEPKHLTSLIERDIQFCQRLLVELEAIIADASEPRRLKAWLKTVRFGRSESMGWDEM